jgi:coatomer subunit beta'
MLCWKTKLRCGFTRGSRREGNRDERNSWSIEGLHGEPLLCARGNGFVLFWDWDWESGEIIRRIDVEAKNVCPPTIVVVFNF